MPLIRGLRAAISFQSVRKAFQAAAATGRGGIKSHLRAATSGKMHGRLLGYCQETWRSPAFISRTMSPINACRYDDFVLCSLASGRQDLRAQESRDIFLEILVSDDLDLT